MSPQVLIFANPYSGSGPNRKRVDRLASALQAKGLHAVTIWKPEARLAALEALEGDGHVVVAAGGDGSIADVVNDMNAADRLGLPFATLPVGNENLFAQAYGFTLKAEPLAEAIQRGVTRPMDLVRIHSITSAGDGSYEDDPAPAEAPDDTPPRDRLFTLMVSAGFDAEVIHRLDLWRKSLTTGELHRVNRLSYVKRILEAIRGYRYPGVTLVADGQENKGHQVYIFNLPKYGGGLKFAPGARADDQQLDWVMFERPGFFRLLGYHLLVLRGQHPRGKTVATGRSRDVSLRTTNGQAVPTQADGDPAGHTPLQLDVLPAALNVIAM